MSPQTRPDGQPDKTPVWPPLEDEGESPLFSLAGMYAVLKRAVSPEDDALAHTQLAAKESAPTASHIGTVKPVPLLITLPELASQHSKPMPFGASPQRQANLPSPLSVPKTSGSESSRPTFITQSIAVGHYEAPEIRGQTQATATGTAAARRRATATESKRGKQTTKQTEIRLVANAPSLPLSGRAVHPFFLAGTLLHGLPSTPSPAITGEKVRRRAQHATPQQPVGWSTAEFVNNCVRPALGPTRICYVQALACGAAEVDWCPEGHFTSDLRPLTHTTSDPKKHAAGLSTQGSHTPSRGASQGTCRQMGSDPSPPHTISISTSASLLQDQAPLEVTLPEDLYGRLSYGPVTYYVAHAWQQSWGDLVTAILHHYSRLPEVVRTGGTQFVPVYYWVDVFAVAQYERTCPELKHHPDKALTSVLAAPSCQGVLMAAQPWAQPVALTRAWCLYEVNLARMLGRELHVMLMEEQPGPDGHSPRLPLARLSGLAAAAAAAAGTSASAPGGSSAGSGPGGGGLRSARGALAGDTRVIEAVDSALSVLDLTYASTRFKADMGFITSQASRELGGVVGFNLALRSYLRPHILAALLSALLRSSEPRIWGAAAALIKAGAFLQWGAPSFVVDVNSPAGAADDAAAFLGLALHTRAPRGPAAPTADLLATPTISSNHTSPLVYNPIQELVFVSPEGPNQPQQASDNTPSVNSSSDALRHGSNASASTHTESRDRQTSSGATRLTSQSSVVCSQSIKGGSGGGQGSRPSSRCASPRQCIDGGVVARSPRGIQVQHVVATEDAITRSLARMKSNACTMSRGRHASGSESVRGDLASSDMPCGPPADYRTLLPQQLSLSGVNALCPALVGNTCLTTLVLSGHPIGCEGTSVICKALSAKPCAMRHLRLRGCGIGPEGAGALGQLLAATHSCSLAELDVGGNLHMGSKGAVALSTGLSHTRTLRELHMDHCSIDSYAAAALATVLLGHLDSIHAFKLTGPTVQGMHSLETGVPIVPYCGLEVVNLGHNKIGVDSAEALAALLAHPACAIRELTLSHNQLETPGALAVAHALQVNKCLQVLRLRDNQLALEVGAALGMALCGELLPGVRNPRAHHSTLGPVPWPGGHAPTQHPHRSSSDDEHDTEACEDDSGLTPPLVTCTPGSGGEDRWLVQQRADPCAVRELDLGDNPFLGDVGVELLAQGVSLAHGRCALSVLLLDNTGCGAQGASALARALTPHGGDSRASTRPNATSTSSTHTLRAAQRRHTHATAGEVVGSSTGLHTLDLSDNPLRSLGGVALAAVVPAAVHLRTLRLRNCQIGASGRLALLTALQFSGNSSLRELDLSGNGVHPAEYVPRPMHFAVPDKPAPMKQNSEHARRDRPKAQATLGCAHQYSRADDSLPWMRGATTSRPTVPSECATAAVNQGDTDLDSDLDQRVPQGGGLSKLEAALAQSLTIARQLQVLRPGLSIQF